MAVGKDQSKDRSENWQFYGVWKLPFSGHRAIKLSLNCIIYQSVYKFPRSAFDHS